MKLVTKGKKKFTGRCVRCGCIFEYDLTDLSPTDMVHCPDCGKLYAHPRQDLEEDRL